VKLKTTGVKVIMDDTKGFVIRLESTRKYVDIVRALPDAAIGIITFKERNNIPSPTKSAELNLNDLIKTLIPPDALKEIYVRAQDKERYTAEVMVGDKTMFMMPSVAVYLATVTGCPLFFDSEIGEEDKSYAMIV